MDNVIFAIQSALEEFSWLFIHIQRNNGTLSLPREFIDFFCKVKQPDWASYYESQQKLDTIAVMIFFEPEDIREMADEIRQLPPADVHAYRKEIEDYVCAEFGELKSSPFDFHFLSPKEVEVYLQTTSLDQQQKDLVKAYLMFTTFITQTFQFLALATHGRTMHELVTAAIDGDDVAFCQAIQIDRTVLFAIPYFKNRLIQMQLGHETTLLQSVGRAMSGKLWGGRFPNPEMWVVFSILHRDGRLKSMPLDQLLDICVQLKVHKGTDTNTISKRKNEFLKRQGRAF
jgi:hypothetical protein